MRTQFSLRDRAHVRGWPNPAVCVLAIALACGASSAFADESKSDSADSSCARLSVLNGGEPRGENSDQAPADKQSPFARIDLNDGIWLFLVDREDDVTPDADENDADGNDAAAKDDNQTISAERFRLGHLSDRARPLAGDFDGDGDSEFVLYLDGEWFVDFNGNGQWDDGDVYVRLGDKGDQPVVGDWDGDGKDDLGVFGSQNSSDGKHKDIATAGLPDAENKQASESKPALSDDAKPARPVRLLQKTSGGNVQADEVDYVLLFDGHRGVPLAGDFNGDGVDTLAIFDNGRWFIDVDGDGQLGDADFTAEFGKAGDLPFVADFNGDGVDEIGVFRDGVWFVDSNSNRQLDEEDLTFKLGSPGDRPAPADLFGNGKDVPATYRARATEEKNAEPSKSESATNNSDQPPVD